MSAKVSILWVVPLGYDAGDYALLCGNDGAGDIDYDSPLSAQRYELFPDGAGIYTMYKTPSYQSPCYYPWATRASGCYYQPCYQSPCYYGTAVIEVEVEMTECGEYEFALKVFDSIGNANTGTPDELAATIHIAPDAPDIGLKKNSYDKATDILVLDVAA